MKSREVKFLTWFNWHTGLDLNPTSDTFSNWDFQNKDYIVELKIRNDYYKTKFIQADKGLNLLQNGELLNKIPLYVVADQKAAYVFNLNKIDFTKKKLVRMLAPATTEFNKHKKVNKYFFELEEKESKKMLYL